MTNFDVVKKLIGPVYPIGESHIDTERFENLKQYCDLAEDILTQIKYVALSHDRQEHSMKRAGEYATNFLKNIIDENGN